MKQSIYCFSKKLFLFILLFISFGASGQVINTIAGIEASGYSGDMGAANNAQINNPTDLVADTLGNLYIADFQNNVIRIVTPDGIIGTYAGTGFGAGSTVAMGGYSGDGGPATGAELNGPYGLALDKSGNLYFADGYNHVVRKINHAGIITTFAGNGAAGYLGDGTLATAAELDNPVAVALDHAGNVYIADDHNHVIRKVNTSGVISTFAGNHTYGYSGDGGPATAAEFNLPIGLAVDQETGNVYIADENYNNIRVVDPTGTINAYVGNDTTSGYSGDGGPATAAKLFAPAHIALDNSGNLYISDLANNLVRMVDGTTKIISTFAGNFYGPDTTGTTCQFGGDGGPATAAQMCVPTGVAIADSGKVYIADRDNNVIRLVSPYYFAGVHPVTSVAAATLNAYPSPAAGGAFTINLVSGNTEHVLFTITNILGEAIKEINGATNTAVSVKLDAPPGIYFLSATTALGNWNKQIAVAQ